MFLLVEPTSTHVGLYAEAADLAEAARQAKGKGKRESNGSPGNSYVVF